MLKPVNRAATMASGLRRKAIPAKDSKLHKFEEQMHNKSIISPKLAKYNMLTENTR